MRYSRKRVVITGMGAITPLGESVDEYWNSLVAGKSGIGPLTLVDASEFPSKIAGEVAGFDPVQYIEPRQARRMARFSQMAVAASGIALEDSGVNLSGEASGRLGVVMGNGIGGFPTTEENTRILVEKGGMKMSPHFISMILPNMASANVSRIYGLKGYTSTIITACAAGNQAIGEAAVALQRGVADLVVAGGCEAGICEIGLGGFNVIRALSRHNEDPAGASRPSRPRSLSTGWADCMMDRASSLFANDSMYRAARSAVSHPSTTQPASDAAPRISRKSSSALSSASLLTTRARSSTDETS